MSNTLRHALIEAMLKHLPPSASSLRLLDIGGKAAAVFTLQRQDIAPLDLPEDPAQWLLEPETADAAALFDLPLTDDLLTACLRALRPGGRFVIVQPEGSPSRSYVDRLAAFGYVRILVENALEDPDAPGVLMRGEKPHKTENTLERIRVAAQHDDRLTDLEAYPGRYLHLLVQQSPNKPAWALRGDEQITWHAVALQMENGPALLAFSSLAKAVSFMQPAVLKGALRDVNKVAKFDVSVVRSWDYGVMLNVDPAVLTAYSQLQIPLDPSKAERSDE